MQVYKINESVTLQTLHSALKKKLRFALVPFLSLQNKSTFKVAHVSRIKKKSHLNYDNFRKVE